MEIRELRKSVGDHPAPHTGLHLNEINSELVFRGEFALSIEDTKFNSEVFAKILLRNQTVLDSQTCLL